MNYDFWKKAGVATAVIGTVAVAGSVLASDSPGVAETTQRMFNQGRNGIMRPMQNAQGEKWQEMREHREQVQAALEARDYDAWAALMTEDGRNPKLLEVITADNFGRFVDMHEAIKSGDKETADAIRQELGLPDPGSFKPGNGPKMMHTPEEREAIQQAILSGDYQAWHDLVAVDGKLPPHLQTINQENFGRFVEMHQHMDSAHQIREELGLPAPGNGKGMGMKGNGMHRGFENGGSSANQTSR